FFVLTGAAQLGVYLLGAVQNIESLGAVRAVQLLYGPMNVIFLGAYVTLLPKGIGTDREAFRRALRKASMALSAFTVLCTAALLAAPPSLGHALLGATWPSAHRLVVPFGLYMLTQTAATGPSIGLAALEQAGTLTRVRLGSVPAVLLIPVAAGARWGAT